MQGLLPEAELPIMSGALPSRMAGHRNPACQLCMDALPNSKACVFIAVDQLNPC